MKRKTSISIEPDQAGRLLLDYVAARFTYRSRKDWQSELSEGRFMVNNAVATLDTILNARDFIVYDMPDIEEPRVDFRYSILHEDEDLLVVNKPAPLPCHPGGRFFQHTLWSRLRKDYGPQTPMFVNRLDRETSGVVVLAKNSKSAHICQRQFVGQLVEKLYLVLVEGDFPAGQARAEGWLTKDPQSTVRKKVRFCRAAEAKPTDSQSCSTTFRLRARHEGLSLLEAIPHTGRCHQIRATLFSLGYPVVGDKLYGVDDQLFLRFMEDSLSHEDYRRLRLPRQALHSASLTMSHPTSEKKIIFTAPLPQDFSSIFPITAGNSRPRDQ